MHPKFSLALASLVPLVSLALIAATGCQSHAAAPKVVVVVIRGFKFEPETLTVHEGDAVEWRNEDPVPHTATADGGAHKPAFDSGNIPTGAVWRYVAQDKGTYPYICTLHPNMKAKLIVQ